MIYLFFWIALYLSACGDVISSTRNMGRNNLIYFFLFLFFVILAGCRYKTGYDWNAYMSFFNRINERNIFSRMEVGYAWMNYFFKNLFDSYAFMQFTEIFLCTFILFRFCKLYSPYPCLSIFIYASSFFYSYNMGLTRQFIAMSISLVSVMAIHEKKRILALSCIITAFLFHKSAIVTVLYFFCYKIHFRKFVLIIFIILSIFLNIFGDSVIWNVIEKFFSFSFFSNVFGKYSSYLVSSVWSSKQGFSTGLGYFLRMALIFYTYIFKKNDSSFTNFVFNAVVLDLFIGAFGRNILIVGRLGKYFELYEVVLFAYLFESLSKQLYVYLRPVVFLPLLFYFLIAPINFTKGISSVDGKSQWAMFYPWNSIFYPIENYERNARMKVINAF